MSDKVEKTLDTVNESLPVMQIALDQIEVDESFNARKSYSTDLIDKMVADIKRNGLINPLQVRRNAKGKYDLVSGFTRYRALSAIAAEAKKEGGKGVSPVVPTARVLPQSTDDAEIHMLNLKENVMRKDLTPYEIAVKCRFMVDTYEDMSAAKLGSIIDKGTKYINNLMRIVEKVHPDIVDVWSNPDDPAHKKATVDWLLKRATEDHDTQWEKWLEHIGASAEGEGDDGEEGEEKGGKEEKGEAPARKPSTNMLEAAMKAIKESEKPDDWKAGALAALRFASAQKPTIPGVFNPKDKAKGKAESRAEA